MSDKFAKWFIIVLSVFLLCMLAQGVSREVRAWQYEMWRCP